MSNKENNPNPFSDFSLSDFVEFLDPTGEKKQKAIKYLTSLGYDSNNDNHIDEAVKQLSNKLNSILDSHSEAEIDANNGNNPIKEELDRIIFLTDGLTCLKAFKKMS